MALTARATERIVTPDDALAANAAARSMALGRRASHGQASSRGAALARAALGEMDSNAAANGDANGDVVRAGVSAAKANDASGRVEGLHSDDSAPMAKRARVDKVAAPGDGLALPRDFQTLLDVYEAVILVGRLLRVRQGTMTADVVCANVQRTVSKRCTLDMLRRLEAVAPGTIAFQARTACAEDLRRIHTEIDFEVERTVSDVRRVLLEIVARAHDGDAYVQGELPSEWRDDFDLNAVALPDPVQIAFMEDDERDGPKLAAEHATNKLAAAAARAEVASRVTDSEVARAISEMGADADGLSEKAVRAALERKVALDEFNDPSAVAERARRKLYGRLPFVFDAVRSIFSTAQRRVMEFDQLMDTLVRTNARQSVATDELTDSVRILARVCPEWCEISHGQHADVELFRVVSKNPEIARQARGKLNAMRE